MLSHLGSGAEIFELFLTAGLDQSELPGPDQMSPIWDEWNAKAARDQADHSIARNRDLVARFEALDPAEMERFRLELFGRDTDIAELARMRLAEHVVHTWDVAVVQDPDALVAQDAVEQLIDTLDVLTGFAGRAGDREFRCPC